MKISKKTDYLLSLFFFCNLFALPLIYLLFNTFIFGRRMNIDSHLFGIRIIYILILICEILIISSIFISYVYCDHVKINYNIFINSLLTGLPLLILLLLFASSSRASAGILLLALGGYIISVIFSLIILLLTNRFRKRVEW